MLLLSLAQTILHLRFVSAPGFALGTRIRLRPGDFLECPLCGMHCQRSPRRTEAGPQATSKRDFLKQKDFGQHDQQEDFGQHDQQEDFGQQICRQHQHDQQEDFGDQCWRGNRQPTLCSCRRFLTRKDHPHLLEVRFSCREYR